MDEPIQSTEQAITKCPECESAVVPGKIFCNNCGYPVNGTADQKSTYEIDKFKLQQQLKIAEKNINSGRTTLYVLGGLLLVISLIAGLALDEYSFEKNLKGPKTLTLVFFVILAAIYISLGVFTAKKPFAAQLTAFIVFCTILILGIVADPSVETIFGGFIWKILIIVALVRGTKGAYEAEKIKKQLHID